MAGAGSGVAPQEKRRKIGLKNIDMLPQNWFWNEVGCRRNSSTLVGQMKVNVKLATRRKAQKSTGSTVVRVGMKSGAKSQRPAESVSKKARISKRSRSGKEVLSRILSVKTHGTRVTSV